MTGRMGKRPIAIRLRSGLNTDYQPVFGDWDVIYGKVVDTTGRNTYQEYGVEYSFDKVIHLEANDTSRRINDFTLFCIDVMPYNNYRNIGDYIIKYKFPEKNGIITIGLERLNPISIPKICYTLGEQVLLYDLDYNQDNKTAYVSVDEYIPFAIGDIVTDDAYETELKLVSKQKTGLDANYTNFYKLTFEVVNG